jgi:hypothetical protein
VEGRVVTKTLMAIVAATGLAAGVAHTQAPQRSSRGRAPAGQTVENITPPFFPRLHADFTKQ